MGIVQLEAGEDWCRRKGPVRQAVWLSEGEGARASGRHGSSCPSLSRQKGRCGRYRH